MNKLSIQAVKSKIITENDSIITVLKNTLKTNQIQEKTILVISSKVLAITQKRVRTIKNQKQFDELVNQEADQIIGGDQVTLTLKENIFIPWAGIDRSNIPDGKAVLWPKNPQHEAEKLLKELKKHYKKRQLGIVITDSFCVPLRKGTMGIALAYAGFEGVKDERGHKDLYKKPLKVTQVALADLLASAAHLVMGEADERCPFAIIQNAPVKFTSQKRNVSNQNMDPKECIFTPLYKNIF